MNFTPLKFGLITIAVMAAAPSPLQAQQPTGSSELSGPLRLGPRRDLRSLLQTPMPPGAFASWPDDVRESAVQAVQYRCASFAVSAFNNFVMPPEAVNEAAIALISDCVANAMPDDWPQQTATRDQAKSRYEAAKRIAPNMPNLSALAKEMGDKAKKGLATP